MSEITNTIVQKIVIPKIQGAPQLKELAGDSRKAAQATGEIGTAVGVLDSKFKVAGKTGKDAFRDINTGATSARQSVKQLGDEADRTSKKVNALGLSGRQMKGLAKYSGMGGAFGMGRLAMAGGGVGLGIMAAADLGHMGLNAMYNQKFGQGPLQKEDAGMLLGTVGSVVDTFSGRKYREAAHESQLEKIAQEAADREKVMQSINQADWRRRSSMLSAPELGRNPEDKLRIQEMNLKTEKAFHESRLHFRTNLEPMLGGEPGRFAVKGAPVGRMREMYQAFNKANTLYGDKNAPADARMKAMQDMLRIQEEIVRLSKEEQVNAEKLVDIEAKRKELGMQRIAMTRAGLENKAEKFNEMNPMERLETIDFAKRFKAGERLSVDEEQAMRSNTLLAPMLRERKMQETLDNPQFRQAIMAGVGNDQEKAAVEKAQKLGVGIEAVIKLDSQQLIDDIKKGVEAANAQLVNAVVKQQQQIATLQAVLKMDKAARGALVER
jgi:hypothetical protein